MKFAGNLKWLVIAVVCFALAIWLMMSAFNNSNEGEVKECLTNSDCVPASCCHPNSCVPIIEAPNCDEILCSQECKPGTLDCGQGNCACENNKCGVSLSSGE